MIPRILVPLDVSGFSGAATEWACFLAKTHGSQVTGMTVLDTPDITGEGIPFYPADVIGFSRETVRERLRDAQDQIGQALDRFRQRCDAANVPHSECRYQGVPSRCIIDVSRYYDLLVIGCRTAFRFETRGETDTDSLEDILHETPAPVLAVPERRPPRLQAVLVAFDGSLNAVRALRAFAQLGPAFQPAVTVLTADNDSTRAEHLAEEAAAFLRAHRFETLRVLTSDRSILDAVEDCRPDTDLIVAGVNSKHRLKSFFLGSLIKRLIRQAQTPLLLGQ